MNAYIAVIQLYTKQLTIKMPRHHITLKTRKNKEKTRKNKNKNEEHGVYGGNIVVIA